MAHTTFNKQTNSSKNYNNNSSRNNNNHNNNHNNNNNNNQKETKNKLLNDTFLNPIQKKKITKFQRFVVIELLEETPLAKSFPFLIELKLSSWVNPLNVKKFEGVIYL